MRRLVAITVLIAGLAIAGCGTSGSSSSSSSAPSASTSASTPAASGSPPAGVSTALAYTGGTAGAADASKSPITIGFIGQQGGIPSYPEQIVTAQAATQYINNYLGGINGHPLKLQTCIIASTEQQAQVCADQFLNNAAIPLIASGGVSNGNQSLHQTLAGKVPFIDGDAGSPVDAVAANTILLTSGVLGVPGSLAGYITKYYKPKTASLIGPNQAEIQAAIGFLKSGLEKSGTKVSEAQFAPTTSDLLAPLTAANAKNADVLVPFVFTPNCPSVAKALTQLGRTKPVVGLGLCIDPSVKQALGDYPKWDILFPNQNPYYPQGSTQVASYLAGLKKFAGPSANVAGYAGFAWSSVLTAARVMNKIGATSVTRATVTNAIKHYSGPGFMDPPAKCGAIPSSPAVCTLVEYIYKYLGNGQWSDPTHGQGAGPTG